MWGGGGGGWREENLQLLRLLRPSDNIQKFLDQQSYTPFDSGVGVCLRPLTLQ